MDTRFYDSAEPGPPHGWLDADQGVPSKMRTVWENAVTVIQEVARRLAGSQDADDASSQTWGVLRAGGCWWIYHVIPAGEDRFGRPGRTLAVLFCSNSKQGFDWQTIRIIAPELEVLAKNRSHLTALLRQLDNLQINASATLTDDLLKSPSTPLLEALKSEMGSLLDGLEEGDHEYFTISGNGSISNRKYEDISPPSPPPPPAPKPVSERTPISAPGKKLLIDKPLFMKNFISHALVLGIGLLLGFVLNGFPPSKPSAQKPAKNQPTFSSEADAISHLRAATDHLEQSLRHKKQPFSSDMPPSPPQHQSSKPVNPPN